LALENGEFKAIQGVRELFDIFDMPQSSQDEETVPSTKIVLIGRHLEDHDFGHSLICSLQL
jgi:hypothetical protein